MDNHLLEDKNVVPAKTQPEPLPCGVGRTSVAASGHRLRLGLCLVGPDVKLVGAGAGLVSLVWFVGLLCICYTGRDRLRLCLRIHRVFFLFRTCAPENINL